MIAVGFALGLSCSSMPHPQMPVLVPQEVRPIWAECRAIECLA
jgi:hypothetical protein